MEADSSSEILEASYALHGVRSQMDGLIYSRYFLNDSAILRTVVAWIYIKLCPIEKNDTSGRSLLSWSSYSSPLWNLNEKNVVFDLTSFLWNNSFDIIHYIYVKK